MGTNNDNSKRLKRTKSLSIKLSPLDSVVDIKECGREGMFGSAAIVHRYSDHLTLVRDPAHRAVKQPGGEHYPPT